MTTPCWLLAKLSSWCPWLIPNAYASCRSWRRHIQRLRLWIYVFQNCLRTQTRTPTLCEALKAFLIDASVVPFASFKSYVQEVLKELTSMNPQELIKETQHRATRCHLSSFIHPLIHQKKQALDLAVQLSLCMTDPQGFSKKYCSAKRNYMKLHVCILLFTFLWRV
jgi:hypothetical protein